MTEQADTLARHHDSIGGTVQYEFSVLADRMELLPAVWGMETTWPEFMRHDPIGNAYYSCVEAFAEHVVVCLDDTGAVAATAFSVPYRAETDTLPDDGWDGVIRRGLITHLHGDQPNRVSAVEIAIRPDQQGSGLSATMLAALRDNAARHGFAELVAPVRPNGKTDVEQRMSAYATSVRDDGLPVDPWLRVHLRAGGQMVGIAPRSLVIPGTVEEWRDWTGQPFDRTGPVQVPGALAPVHCDLEHGTATYVEPNVWIRHRTGA